MKDILTTYTIVGSNFPGTIILKYDLKGDLRHFSIEEAELNQEQREWLYLRVPINENKVGVFRSIKTFTVHKGEPDISFDVFWEAYGNKVKRVKTKAIWDKMTKADRLNALAGIRGYDRYLAKTRIAKAHPSTYLNQSYWEDEGFQGN